VLRLIEALKGVKCHLVIVGGFNELTKKNLEQCHIEHSWLEKLSEVELIEQYQRCDMITFISTIEGFGMPILEAQAVGRPIVTSNVSSMPEVAGDGACYVDPFDIDAIHRGILKVIQDINYRNILIEKGYANIKRFELTKVSNMYLDLYQNIYSASAPRKF